MAARQVLDADGGAHPALARDVGRDRGEVQALVGEALTGLEREEAVDPETRSVELGLVAPHAVDLEPVGETRDRLRLHERTQRGGVVGRDALVGVE